MPLTPDQLSILAGIPAEAQVEYLRAELGNLSPEWADPAQGGYGWRWVAPERSYQTTIVVCYAGRTAQAFMLIVAPSGDLRLPWALTVRAPSGREVFHNEHTFALNAIEDAAQVLPVVGWPDGNPPPCEGVRVLRNH